MHTCHRRQATANLQLLLPGNEVGGNVIFSQACVSHSVHGRWVGGGSLYDVTSCLAAWSHVPSRVSVSGSMFLPGGLCPGGVSVQRSFCPGEVSVPGGLCQGDPPDRDPHLVKSR